jgi:1-acyl-sn-glycerol-3-phosphate acyltransferase
VRTAVELIRKGWSLLLYPEGTRSRSGELGPFKAGVGALARFTRRPVVPIHVRGGRRVLPTGAFLPRPGHMTVRFGPALQPDRREPLEDFALRLRSTISTLGNGAALPGH